jgi:branched-subunit amino acid ABC-type transport system permease component
MQTVRTIFGAQNVPVENPSWMSGGIEAITGVVLPWSRIVIIGFAGAVLVLIWLLLTRTRLGLFVRAVTQNRAMASCTGVPTGRVDMWAFGLGSGLAGLAGCALSQIGNVGPDLGQSYIVDSFMVVVLGGVGQLAGTVYAAMGLGIDKFLEAWSGAVLAKICVLVFIIVFIQKRPQGLFAQGKDCRGVAMNHAASADGPPLRPRPCRTSRASAGRCVVVLRRRPSLFVVFPVLHLMVPADSVWHLSDYTVTLIGKIMCYAIVALAMDLIWGYTGILSLGHGTFFALGGCDGDVSDALHRPGRRVSQRFARLHGVPRLEGISMVLELHRSLLVRGVAGRAGAGVACFHCSASSLRSRIKGVLLDHHAGDDLRLHAAVLSE